MDDTDSDRPANNDTAAMAYVPEHGAVVVPATKRLTAQIGPGSGIWATPTAGGQLLCDFEGNLYRSGTLERYADRVAHARGRQQTLYPTVARLLCDPGDVHVIGTFDDVDGRVIVDPDSVDTLLAWAPATREDEQLLTSNVRHGCVRELRRLLAVDPVRAALIARHTGPLYREAGEQLGIV